MDKEIIKGFKFSLGFILGLFLLICLFFGIVWATGFHSANEILSGTFSGNFIFEDNVSFNGNVNGIISGGFEINQTEYTIPGEYNFIVPENAKMIEVLIIAGGGGGTRDTTYGAAAGGGALKKFIVGEDILVGENILLKVGSGGVAPSSPCVVGNLAGDGENSWFGTYLNVTGGEAGASSLPSGGECIAGEMYISGVGEDGNSLSSGNSYNSFSKTYGWGRDPAGNCGSAGGGGYIQITVYS